MTHALIFDMDGVIVDSMPFHTQAWEQYLGGLGYDAAGLNSRMHGKHNDALLREFLGPAIPDSEIQRMGAEKEALYRELISPQLMHSLIPGVGAFLRQHAAVPKAVASNAEAANVDFVLDHANLRPHFRVAMNGQQVRFGKPHPEIYEKTAVLLQVPAEKCIVFEDSQTGIDAAIGAGMTVVAINSHQARLRGAAFETTSFTDPQLNSWLAAHIQRLSA
jgi:beta-phosphoglucomutase